MLKFDWNALFVLINLIVFFLLMKKFLFGRIAKVINERQAIIDKQLKDAENTNAEADKKLADYESKIANAEAEREQIIAGAKDDAKTQYDKIIDKAEFDAEQIKADAKAQAQADIESAKRAAREEIATLAMQAAEKVVGASVTAATDSAIFDEFLGDNNE